MQAGGGAEDGAISRQKRFADQADVAAAAAEAVVVGVPVLIAVSHLT